MKLFQTEATDSPRLQIYEFLALPAHLSLIAASVFPCSSTIFVITPSHDNIAAIIILCIQTGILTPFVYSLTALII